MTEPLDKIDGEQIAETLLTPGWALIAARMQAEAARKVRSLIDSGQEVEFNRGFIQGLETAIKIPKIMTTEARQK